MRVDRVAYSLWVDHKLCNFWWCGEDGMCVGVRGRLLRQCWEFFKGSMVLYRTIACGARRYCAKVCTLLIMKLIAVSAGSASDEVESEDIATKMICQNRSFFVLSSWEEYTLSLTGQRTVYELGRGWFGVV